MTYTIERASPVHVPAITAMRVAYFTDKHVIVNESDVADCTGRSIVDPSCAGWVALHDSAVIGVLMIRRCENQLRRGTYITAQEVFLVPTAYQGYGIGSALIHEAEQWAQQQGCMAQFMAYGAIRHTAWFSKRGYTPLEQWTLKQFGDDLCLS